MSDTQEKVLLEITLDDSNAIQRSIELKDAIELIGKQIAVTKDEIKKYEAAQKTNTVEYKNASASLVKYENDLRGHKSTLATYSNLLTQNVKANIAEQGSLNQKRATLNALNAEYANLANPTQELTNKIKSLSDELKKQESALGNDTRSVGSYKQAIREAKLEAEQFGKTLGFDSEQAKTARANAAVLTEEYQKFNKTVGALDTEGNLNKLSNSTGNITNGLASATSQFKLFGAASDTAGQAISGIGSGISTIASAPQIIKDLKISFEGLAVAENLALGPIGLLTVAISGIAIAYAEFSKQTTDLTLENMNKQQELVASRYQFEIDLAEASGKNVLELRREALEQARDNATKEIEIIQKRNGVILADKIDQNADENALTLEGTVTREGYISESEQKLINEQLDIRIKANNALKELSFEHITQLTGNEKKKTDEKNTAVVLSEELSQEQRIINWQKFEDNFNAINLKSKQDEADRIAAGIKFSEDQHLQDIQDNLLTSQLKLQASQDQSDAELNIAVVQSQLEVDLIGKTEAQKALLIKASQNKIMAIEAAASKTRLQNTADLIGATSGLFKQGGNAFKALSLAQAFINMWSGATAATAPPPVGLGPVSGIPLAIKTVISGFANIASIAGVQFYDGGYTGDGDPRSTSTQVGNRPYVYHQQEYVVPHQLVDHPYVYALESMRTGNGLGHLGGFASGGFTNTSNLTASIDSDNMINGMMNAILNAPAPVVSVEAIEIVTNQENQRRVRAIS